jgi:endonuclease YncB( thermonuclease family)
MLRFERSAVLCFWMLAMVASIATAAEPFTAKVTRIKDGDTIVVLRDAEQIDLRLEGIDCPESGQPFGQKAKQAVSKVAFGKTVTVRPTGTDRYGRTLGVVVLPDGLNVNQALVKYGYAWWYRKYSNDQTLAKLETEARKKKRGLWADPRSVAPWDWRDQQKSPDKEALANVPVVPNGVEIVAMLPNPDGVDEGNEMVTISNGTGKAIDFNGWRLVDRAGNRFQLSGKVSAGRGTTFTLDPPTMPLNNDGDSILLFDADGVPVFRATYLDKQVRAGEWVLFGGRTSK